MTITDQQARAIAYLLHEIRPDWGIASLVSLIYKHRDYQGHGPELQDAGSDLLPREPLARNCQEVTSEAPTL